MSGIPLTDEGVTSDGGAGETISLPPKTSMFLTSQNVKCQPGGNAKKPSNGMQSHFMYFLSYSVWVGFYQSNSELILFSRLFCVRCWRNVTQREQRHVQASSNYSCTPETMESGVNIITKSNQTK